MCVVRLTRCLCDSDNCVLCCVLLGFVNCDVNFCCHVMYVCVYCCCMYRMNQIRRLE